LKYELFTTKATSALSTKVTTFDGVVSITGEAGSEAEKSLVTKLANEVRGVKAVSNAMTLATKLNIKSGGPFYFQQLLFID